MFPSSISHSVKSCIALGLLYLLLLEVQASYMEDHYTKDVIDDATLDNVQLLKKYKYPSETHYVTTKDKYILRLHRIPKPGAPPVFLMHGLMDSSDTWILMGPKNALGYYLYDNGYDVWMGNARGNRYSRNHTTLDPNNDRSFWTFSWHEIGIYDLPTSIDYVLQTTGFNKTGYFGHSQGTTSFWVMCSMLPEYNDKITMMHALAPVAFMKHIDTPLVSLGESIFSAYKTRIGEFLPRTDILWRSCFASKTATQMCYGFFTRLVGEDSEQTDMTKLPTVYGHLPAGCNFKQMGHYLQLVESDRFCQYDYGSKKNQNLYGKQSPPEYPLVKITAPVGLYYAQNDYLASVVDVKRLIKLLPNVVMDNMYPHKKWNHMTMMWGKDARELAHKQMLEIMKNYSYE